MTSIEKYRKTYCLNCVCYKCRLNNRCRDSSCNDCGHNEEYSVVECPYPLDWFKKNIALSFKQKGREEGKVLLFKMSVSKRHVISALLKQCEIGCSHKEIFIIPKSKFAEEKLNEKANFAFLSQCADENFCSIYLYPMGAQV